MSNMREAYAATHHANLDWKEDRERAIDRIAAAGFADPLGIALWRAKYLSESLAYRDANKRLVDLYRDSRSKHETQFVVEKIVDQVLHEYLSSACRACDGAREIIVGELRVMCDTCGGSGVRKYDDMGRARMMSLSLDRIKRLSRSIGWLAAEVSARDIAVNTVLLVQLERISS